MTQEQLATLRVGDQLIVTSQELTIPVAGTIVTVQEVHPRSVSCWFPHPKGRLVGLFFAHEIERHPLHVDQLSKAFGL